MSIVKECCCWECHKQADVPSDLTQEDMPTSVLLCEGCEEAGCDPFEETGARCHEEPEAPEVEERQPCVRDECAGEGHLLGVLGRLAHYRCRACGIEFNHAIEEEL